MKCYYLQIGQEKLGPYSLFQVKKLWASGRCNLDTLFCRVVSTSEGHGNEGEHSWKKMEEIVTTLEEDDKFPKTLRIRPQNDSDTSQRDLYIRKLRAESSYAGFRKNALWAAIAMYIIGALFVLGGLAVASSGQAGGLVFAVLGIFWAAAGKMQEDACTIFADIADMGSDFHSRM